MENKSYSAGSTLSLDRFGNLVDVGESLTERFCLLGLAWRIDTGYVSLASTGDYATITFKTPATGRVFYNFATVEKSGNEIVKSLFEGAVISGGVAASAVNFYCDTDTDTSGLTSVKTGISTGTNALTITSSSREIFPSLAAGSAQGNSIPGGSSQLQGLLVLKKNTVYAVKFLCKGAVTCACNVGMAIIPNAE